MIDKIKKRKMGKISEEDISSLLQSYSATTMLALLQEVAQFEGVKIDWDALVKKTKTGISSPREYQMLWRHLAYRHPLLDKHKLEDGAQPVDDDSDLDCELEAFPDVSSEALMEAAACVKVLMGSSLPSDPNHPNSATVEAPLTINIPNGQLFRAGDSQPSSVGGMNIMVPVSVQKLPLPGGTGTEGLDASGSASGNIPTRRRRKPWSEKEDMELMAVVRKYGEGNWATIIKAEAMVDRTASQLSQRWAILRKRVNNLNAGASPSGSQLSEAQRAARHAMNVALDLPVRSTGAVGATSSNNASINPVPLITKVEASTGQHQPQQFPALAKSSPTGTVPLAAGTRSQLTLQKTDLSSNPTRAAAVAVPLAKTSAKSDSSLDSARAAPAGAPSQKTPAKSDLGLDAARGGTAMAVPSQKTSAKSDLSLDPVRAAAVAAGARIATQSDAASLFKAAQANNAIHIMPTGGASILSSIPGGLSPHAESFPNVHYMSIGLKTAPISSPPAASSSSRAVLVKASSPRTHCVSTPATLLNASSEQNNPECYVKGDVETGREIKVSEQTNAELHPGQNAETEVGIKVSEYTNGELNSQIVAEVKEDGACISENEPSLQAQGENAASTIKEAELKSEVAATDCSNASFKLEMAGSDVIGNHTEGNQHAKDEEIMNSPVQECENQLVVQEDSENLSVRDKQADLPNVRTDECNQRPKTISKAEPGNEMQQ